MSSIIFFPLTGIHVVGMSAKKGQKIFFLSTPKNFCTLLYQSRYFLNHSGTFWYVCGINGRKFLHKNNIFQQQRAHFLYSITFFAGPVPIHRTKQKCSAKTKDSIRNSKVFALYFGSVPAVSLHVQCDVYMFIKEYTHGAGVWEWARLFWRPPLVRLPPLTVQLTVPTCADGHRI